MTVDSVNLSRLWYASGLDQHGCIQFMAFSSRLQRKAWLRHDPSRKPASTAEMTRDQIRMAQRLLQRRVAKS